MQVEVENNKIKSRTDHKLPGDFINDEEDPDTAANRVLLELTGLKDIFLQQFAVFGSPERTNKEHDIKWLRDTTGLPIERVVTIAYYALVKIGDSSPAFMDKLQAGWFDVDENIELAFDHTEIMREALKTLRKKLQYEPVGIELLPEKFPLRQVQKLYELILGRDLDNRNFRKKVLKAQYLIMLNEKEKEVAHKPAVLYRFDKSIFERKFNQFEGYQF
jgi:ADP-ribose pyrophosphatase YjhB (NUDIX family)